MKKSMLGKVAASGVVALGLSMAATPAFAAIDFSTATWLVGGVNYQFESTGTDTYGGVEYLTTPTQANDSLGYEEMYWDGGDLVPYDDYGYCYGADATETTEANGDVVISCAAYELTNDVWMGQDFRFFHDQPLTRHVFWIENRGTAAADLDAASEANYLYWYLSSYDKEASSTDPTSCSSPTGAETWIVAAGSADTTITGIAWQAKDATTWTGGGDCSTDYFEAYLNKDSLAAGEKVNYATFIATSEPAGASSGEMDTAFAAAVSGMTAFDSLNETLCRGIEGTTVEGWGTCPATLPNTGIDSSTTATVGLMGAVALVAGFAAIVVVRRRAAQQ